MNAIILVAVLVTLTLKNQYCNIGTGMAQGALNLNYTNLMYHYFIACGYRYICDITNLHFVPRGMPQNISNNFPSILECPACECDDECFRKNTCCPDLYFSRTESTCQKLPTIDFGHSEHPILISPPYIDIIDQCPVAMKNSANARRCTDKYSKMDLLSRVPVTSKTHYQTFRNIYCAACNNITDFVEWGLDIECKRQADFNFLSSYDEIVSVASEHECIITYRSFSKDINVNSKKCSSTKGQSEIKILYNSCNETGYWRHFDADIVRACESQYSLTHRIYKNFFCFMCNPPSHFRPNDDVIAGCAGNGNNHKHSDILKEHCHRFGISFVMWPYKNIFCYLCNVKNESNLTSDYIEGKAERFDYIRLDQNQSKIDFILLNIRLQKDIYKIFLDNVTKDINIDNTKSTGTLLEVVNITNILRYEFAFTGDATYCNKTFTQDEFIVPATECSCDPKCIFSSKAVRCCSEVKIQLPATCQDNVVLKGYDKIPAYNIKYPVVNKCEDKRASEIQRYLCENGSGMDIYSALPIEKNGMLFKNIHCAFCSKGAILEADYEEAFDLEGYCQEDVQYGLITSIQQILDTAISSKCHIEVYKREDTYSRYFGQQHGSQIIHQAVSTEYFTKLKSSQKFCSTDRIQSVFVCNTTGGWKEYVHAVYIMCEKMTSPLLQEYRKVFCKICNPPPEVNAVKSSSCNPRIYNNDTAQACMLYPESVNDFSNMYRNSFCALCDGFVKFKTHDYTNSENSKLVLTVFNRHIFSFPHTRKDNPTKTTTYRDRNSINYISAVMFFDTINNVYRNITCFPGRLFEEGTCEPLLLFATNLKYFLSMELEGNVTKLIISNIKRNILSEVYTAISTQDVSILSEDVFTDSEYILNKQNNESALVRINYKLVFVINEHVNRQETEIRLLQLTSREYSISDVGTFRAFIGKPFTVNASVTNQSKLSTAYMYVSKVLLCPQIIFMPDEFLFYIDKNISNIFIISWAFNISSENFLFTDDGGARSCVGYLEDLQSQFIGKLNSPNTTTLLVLAVTNFVCVTLSCVCLLLTLLTYSVLHKLRTLPGKNNMILVSTILVAQVHLFVGSQIPNENHITCKALGIATHYFVLCMFASMNTCSYHMYKVFTKKLYSSQGRTNTFTKYLIYVFAVPSVIVISNISVSWILLGKVPYGGKNNCMLTNIYSYSLSFYSPICIFSMSNIGFFLLTFMAIRNYPKMKFHTRTKQRNELVIYLKLFSITGITWVLMAIDAQIPVNVMSFAVMIMNAGQGVFIFLSFVCTRNVWNLFKEVTKDKCSCPAVSSGNRAGKRSAYTVSSTDL